LPHPGAGPALEKLFCMADPNLVDRTSLAVGSTLSWLFLLSVLLTCYEVFMGSVFRAPTIWVHDATTMMSATCFLVGGAYALQRGDHIRFTFVYDMLPPWARRGCDLAGLLLALLYLLGLGWFSGMQAFNSIRIVEMSGRAWNVPMPMVIRTALFLGTALFALQAAAEIVKLIRAPRAGR
jgi:TRAP-type mannitol/chloroaromatic compound transport system permease small subunit